MSQDAETSQPQLQTETPQPERIHESETPDVMDTDEDPRKEVKSTLSQLRAELTRIKEDNWMFEAPRSMPR